jgi:hypothetical protein
MRSTAAARSAALPAARVGLMGRAAVGDESRVAVKRQIAAAPSEIFVVITDPNMHVEIDGSGMLESAPDARPLQAAGDTFEMDMDREPLGDIPLGKYKVLNTVTRITPDQLLEWNVGGLGMGPFGHVYGYELVPVGDGVTEVTLYCDWSGVPSEVLEHVTFPVVPVHMLEQSLENLDGIVTSPNG